MAKVKSESATNVGFTFLGIVGIVAWFCVTFFVDTGIDIFYGKYGGLILGGLTAVIAHFKGRNVVAWFSIGAWFVIAGLIVVLVLPKLHDALCPFCKEGISREASVCPHCQRDLDRLAGAKVPDS